jgi:hypothetical protein
MDDEVDFAKGLFRAGENLVEILVLLDIARDDHFGPDRINKLADAAFHLRIGGISIRKMIEADDRVFFVKLLGDCPRNRIIVGDTEHQTFFASHQTHHRFLLQSPAGRLIDARSLRRTRPVVLNRRPKPLGRRP